ncbi:MAG: hypothetical protein P0Y53_03760 [Candidatus Pseudobacter hemicellulosilyticus]|uniref:Uncharacterized protein n=1 Tax=Candidatus Pseudobacter hemicellulosilyticus TaxID=3121375 RepID=A0AAJ6BHU4_9BACT|nr:MAG: hypothetical protein P0Y53_03760 [Pseudobacter sp.]
MNIDRYNYEEYFLLYIDNELSAEERAQVEAFVQQHPDLAEELAMFQQSVFLPGDEELPAFTGKQSLLKPENSIDDSNCEAYFVQYGDDELSNQEKAQVEEFVYRNPRHQADFEGIQQARLSPDPMIVYPDKSSLYRGDKQRRIFPLRRWQYAAAAATLLAAGTLGWFTLLHDQDGQQPALAGNTSATEIPDNKTVTAPAQVDTGTAGPAASNRQDTPQEQTNIARERPATVRYPIKEQAAVTNRLQQDQAARQGQAETGNTGKHVLPVTDQPASMQPQLAQNNPVIKPTQINEKNSNNSSNLSSPPAVTPIVAAAGKQPAGVEKKKDAAAAMETLLADAGRKQDAGEIYGEEELDQFTTATQRKNRMRGLLRRVTRAFERTANIGSGDGTSQTVRVANFEIALK